MPPLADSVQPAYAMPCVPPGHEVVVIVSEPPAAFTVKLWVTGVAAGYVALPACVAWMVQAPAAINVAVVPLTVHTPVVCELKLTGRPELAVATSINGVPTVCMPGFAKVIVCVWPPPRMVKLCVTGVAAAQVLLPGCVA